MSIQSEIDRIKAAKADAKAALIERGVDPGDATIDEYGNQIRAIPTGVTSFNGRTGAVEPQAGDYTAEQVGALPISGGTLTGQLNCGGRLLRGVSNPVSGQDAVNLQYAQANFASKDSAGSSGKRTCRFVVGTSTAGWTKDECDYLCDGTDDQVEINAAIQALPSGGGEIVILDGAYNITATIAMDKDNVKLSGNGNATVLRRMWNSSADEGVITITATNGGCCVENIFVDGNKSAYSSLNNNGIYLSSSSNNTITGNTCNNNNSGIHLYSSSNNTITGNTCNNNGNSGIYLSSSSNNTITGNTCNNNGNSGIHLYSSSNNTITGNTCNNNGNGIYLSSSNNTITGNTCNNNGNGIYLSSSSNNTITGNTCNNNGNSGIYLRSSSNNTITGNTCNNNGNGIYLFNSSSNNTITGNTCIRGKGTSSDYKSSQYTIYLNGTKNNYNLISSNNIMGKNYTSDGGTGNTFVNNKYN